MISYLQYSKKIIRNHLTNLLNLDNVYIYADIECESTSNFYPRLLLAFLGVA